MRGKASSYAPGRHPSTWRGSGVSSAMLVASNFLCQWNIGSGKLLAEHREHAETGRVCLCATRLAVQVVGGGQEPLNTKETVVQMRYAAVLRLNEGD
jgi:hypothetical protein